MFEMYLGIFLLVAIQVLVPVGMLLFVEKKILGYRLSNIQRSVVLILSYSLGILLAHILFFSTRYLINFVTRKASSQ